MYLYIDKLRRVHSSMPCTPYTVLILLVQVPVPHTNKYCTCTVQAQVPVKGTRSTPEYLVLVLAHILLVVFGDRNIQEWK